MKNRILRLKLALDRAFDRDMPGEPDGFPPEDAAFYYKVTTMSLRAALREAQADREVLAREIRRILRYRKGVR